MHRNKNVNSLLILCQVIVHHNHNLLIRDAILVDNLVGMACISLKDRKGIKFRSVAHLNKLKTFGRTCIVKGKWLILRVELILSYTNADYKRKALSHPRFALDK